jgi:hypothetical protein
MPLTDRVVIKSAGRKGLGLFAAVDIARGTPVYSNPVPLRLTMPRAVCEALVRSSSPQAARTLLSHGWASDDHSFTLSLGIERFVNHSNRPNCRGDGIALRNIRKNEEILEDYTDTDPLRPWYVALCKRHGAWTHTTA